MSELKPRYWMFLGFSTVAFSVCLYTGHPFLWASIGCLVFLALIAVDCFCWNASNRYAIPFSICIIFSLVCIHVSAILGSYVALAIVVLFWVSLMTQLWTERKRRAEHQRWMSIIHRTNSIRMARVRREKVNWIKEGF